MSSIRDWLEVIGLDQYAEIFEQNNVDLDVLGELSDGEFKELGVNLGDRKRLQRALRDLGSPNKVVDVIAEPQDELGPAPQAERRNVTVMFCDLVGSTALADGMDPEEFRDLLSVYHEAAREPIRRYGGHIARYLGDGLLVVYGFPRAREDDAIRAVRSALEVVRAVHDLPHVDLQVRLGLATGIVVAGDIVGADQFEEQTVLGDVPNLAAKLQFHAEPNTVLIANSTYELVKNSMDALELLPLSLKGIARPISVYRVIGANNIENQDGGTSSRRSSRMVGREGELALIASRWNLARRGYGQVVMICAEAGVGKSRLVRQIRKDTKEVSRTLITFYCSPYQAGTPFFPIAEAVSRAAGVTPHDNSQEIIEKLKRLLETIEFAPQDGVALLGSILGVATADTLPANPEGRRRRTLDFLTELIVHLAQQDTALIIVEDMHFADSSTIELISLIIQGLDQSPALLLITFRPSFEPPWKRLAHATSIAMNHLTGEESRHLVKAVADEKHLPREVEDEIIARCDGVPLFVEELTKSVIEAIGQGANRIAIPLTLRDTLAARLDALGQAKRVAQAASIIGREFNYRILEGLVAADYNLAEHLEHLEAAELIIRRGEIPEASYLFKHALVQEAAYESLLLADRRSSHLILAEQLAQQTNEVSAAPGLIALHFERGGEFKRALDYRRIAGTEAAKMNALVEAEEHLTQAIELLESIGDDIELEERRTELLLNLGAVQMPLYGFPSKQVLATYSRCYELVRTSNDQSKRFDATWGLWLNRVVAGDLKLSERLTSELDAIAAESKKLGDQLQADHAAWTTVYIKGDLTETYDRTRGAAGVYSIKEFGDHCYRYGGHDPYVCAQAHGALSRWQMGFPMEAVRICEDGIALATKLNHPPSTGVAASLGAIVYQYANVPKTIIAMTEQGRKAPANMQLIMRALSGWSKVQLGAVDKGLDECRSGVEGYEDLGATARLPYIRYLLADSYSQATRFDDAWVEIEAACKHMSDITTLAERYRLKGEILQRLGKTELAEQAYADALTTARKQGAKAWELRTATDLSQLWINQGRRDEAKELLDPIYRSFTEGYETPDLKRANNLLADLAK
jgi:class 3 adenylate cyclase/tetratricopeptide (TPR) repeat protein